MCDERIGGTVGCVLKISHAQQPVPTLQREIMQPCRKMEKKSKKKKKQRKAKKEEEIKELPFCQYCVAQFWGVASSGQVQVEGRGVKRRESAPSRHRVELRPQC